MPLVVRLRQNYSSFTIWTHFYFTAQWSGEWHPVGNCQKVVLRNVLHDLFVTCVAESFCASQRHPEACSDIPPFCTDMCDWLVSYALFLNYTEDFATRSRAILARHSRHFRDAALDSEWVTNSHVVIMYACSQPPAVTECRGHRV